MSFRIAFEFEISVLELCSFRMYHTLMNFINKKNKFRRINFKHGVVHALESIIKRHFVHLLGY